MLKLLFFGSGDFPVPVIENLIESKRIEIVGLITSPDTSLKSNPLHVLAKNAGISSYPPLDINADGQSILKSLNPDINLVCNYGQFLDKHIFDFPRFRTLNIHASLLPILRGACPIEIAILSGLAKTGLTIQILEEKMDVGDIIYQTEVEIDKSETGGTLRKKLQKVAVECIENVVLSWTSGKIIPVKQFHENATYCYRDDISKEAAKINWSDPAIEIERRIRAFDPNPTAWTTVQMGKLQKRVKIFKADVLPTSAAYGLPGSTKVSGTILSVQSGTAPVSIKSLQVEGKNKVNGEEFLRGLKEDIQFI